MLNRLMIIPGADFVSCLFFYRFQGPRCVGGSVGGVVRDLVVDLHQRTVGGAAGVG